MERAEHPRAPRRRSALRSEASARFEKGLSPERRIEAQAVARELMVELGGATLRRRARSTSAARGRARGRSALREARVERAARRRRPARAAGRDPRLARLRRRARRTDGLDVTVPHWRRDDVTREADLIEEVARIDGARASCRRRCPAAPAARPADARASACAAAPRTCSSAAGLHEIAGWSFAAPALLDRLRLPAGRPRCARRRLENPMSEDESILRPTLLGSLLDAARHNLRARRRATSRCSSPAPSTSPAPTAAARATSTTASACCSTGAAAPPTWRAAAAARRLLLGEGAARRGARHAARRRGGRAGERAVPASRAARPRCAPPASGSAGSASCTRSSRASGTSTAGAGVRARPRRCSPGWRPRRATYRDLTSFPAVRQDLAVVVADDVPAGASWRSCASAGGGAARRRRGVRRLAASRRRGPRSRWRCTSSSAPRPDADRRGGRARVREKIVAALRDEPGVSSVADRTRRGRRGLGLRRRARRAARATAIRASSSPRSPRASDAGRRLDDLYPHHRVPLVLDGSTSTRHGEVDAAIVAYPHGAAAPVVARAARARRAASSTCRADFRLRDVATYEQWYGEHPAPELIGEAVYGLPELLPRADRAAPTSSPARAASRPRRSSRSPRCARRADRRRRHRREDRRVGRRAARRPRRRTSSASTRTSSPTRSAATATCRRSTRSWRRPARRRRRHVHRRTSCRSTRASWSPAT